jgi:hypothetical protein
VAFACFAIQEPTSSRRSSDSVRRGRLRDPESPCEFDFGHLFTQRNRLDGFADRGGDRLRGDGVKDRREQASRNGIVVDRRHHPSAGSASLTLIEEGHRLDGGQELSEIAPHADGVRRYAVGEPGAERDGDSSEGRDGQPPLHREKRLTVDNTLGNRLHAAGMIDVPDTVAARHLGRMDGHRRSKAPACLRKRT